MITINKFGNVLYITDTRDSVNVWRRGGQTILGYKSSTHNTYMTKADISHHVCLGVGIRLFASSLRCRLDRATSHSCLSLRGSCKRVRETCIFVLVSLDPELENSLRIYILQVHASFSCGRQPCVPSKASTCRSTA